MILVLDTPSATINTTSTTTTSPFTSPGIFPNSTGLTWNLTTLSYSPSLSVSSSLTITLPASSTALLSSPKSTLTTSSSKHTGAIVGGVIGALALLALSALAFLCLRRRRRHRNRDIPPSAEFMRIARGDSPSLLPLQHDEYAAEGGSAVPLARQSSLEDDERPPAFTPGNYRDPVLEKVQQSAQMREQYDHDAEGGVYAEGGYSDHL